MSLARYRDGSTQYATEQTFLSPQNAHAGFGRVWEDQADEFPRPRGGRCSKAR